MTRPNSCVIRKNAEKKTSPNDLSIKHASRIHRKIVDLMGEKLHGSLGFCDSRVPWKTSTHMHEGRSYARDHVLYRAFWSKYASPDLPRLPGYDHKEAASPNERADAAVQKWLRAELRNRKTNLRFTRFNGGESHVFSRVAAYAAQAIQHTIGESPTFTSLGEFTGGASTRVKRGELAIAEKFEGKAHITLDALPYWENIRCSSQLWEEYTTSGVHAEIVRSSIMFTVPKSSHIDRVACKEPEGNMYLQRMLGLQIRKKLRRFGINLQDQSQNRHLAFVGSKSRSYATIDLSSASDTISREVVKSLLPSEWFRVLDDLRLKQTVLPDGSIHQLEMFSSMGNGFTFELESLIFWALARGAARAYGIPGKISVFGDDIIVVPELARILTRVLPFFGFIMNESKTFMTGPFRESCGGWYTNGSDVTPFFYRERVKNMTDVIQLANQALDWLLKDPLYFIGDPATSIVLELYRYLVKQIPESLHGGQSLQRTDAVVTGDAPRKVLAQRCKPCVDDDSSFVGLYIWWHHEKESGPELGFSPTRAASLGKWIAKRNVSWYVGDLMTDVKNVIDVSLAQYEVLCIVESGSLSSTG